VFTIIEMLHVSFNGYGAFDCLNKQTLRSTRMPKSCFFKSIGSQLLSLQKPLKLRVVFFLELLKHYLVSFYLKAMSDLDLETFQTDLADRFQGLSAR